MSLSDYAVPRDMFTPDTSPELRFPCYACVHCYSSCSEEPCKSCDHASHVPAQPDEEEER